MALQQDIETMSGSVSPQNLVIFKEVGQSHERYLELY